ncbi:MAG: inositol monophosphatase [Candidatus Marinimicrobia bacterium]|nr:inositol monophosphatase [Candidatus Neomarinimicrobiota bacterium]MBL7011029.1 inositol monophosphatase [Candidatus Neomarinimicrobiota bacterium]MBL7029967.1 inositol monophosphatase [Candidatus Neomarinimicrobiota bacterium]
MNNELLAIGQRAARDAGAIILKALNHPRSPDFKGRTNLVTSTDLHAEEVIISNIKSEYPNHAILAEESGADENNSEYEWVIDPLDGTTNFVHGYPSFAVSIACLKKGIPHIAVVLELPSNRLFTATKGEGAFVDEIPIHVSGNTSLNWSLLVTGFGYEHGRNWEANMALFKKFTEVTQGVRRLGAAAVDLCHVACGMVDGFWEFDLHPWDTAAGILIASEAGGMVSQMDGNEYDIHKNHILVTNGEIHKEMLAITKPVVELSNR